MPHTVASESLDEPAADLIMGHSRGDMASVYQQTISDARLIAVSDFVRKWLWPEQALAGSNSGGYVRHPNHRRRLRQTSLVSHRPTFQGQCCSP